jgi:hypothetical protein
MDRELTALTAQQPQIMRPAFAPLFESYLSSCSRAPFVRAARDGCISNRGEVRKLIDKDLLDGPELERFCTCTAAALAEWQESPEASGGETTVATAGARIAKSCDEKQSAAK